MNLGRLPTKYKILQENLATDQQRANCITAPDKYISAMSYNKPDKGDLGEGPKIHKIRITLTSRKVQALEKVTTDLIERARQKRTPLLSVNKSYEY